MRFWSLIYACFAMVSKKTSIAVLKAGLFKRTYASGVKKGLLAKASIVDKLVSGLDSPHFCINFSTKGNDAFM